jgi:IS30 family transposase
LRPIWSRVAGGAASHFAISADKLWWRRLKKSIVQGGLHIEAGRQVGHWECDTENGASHKGAVVTMVERKSGYN